MANTFSLLVALALVGCSHGAPSRGPSPSAPPSAVPIAPTASSPLPVPSASSTASPPPADGGRARLRDVLAETNDALGEGARREELERTLDALVDRLVADRAIGDDAIQAALTEREEINRRASSHGPVPYPSPATAARIFGVPNRLARALARRRGQ